MKSMLKAACVAAIAAVPGAAFAACDEGEIVVKFSHVTNTDRHPKGIAATLLEQRVNDEMNGTMCMEVFANSIPMRLWMLFSLLQKTLGYLTKIFLINEYSWCHVPTL